MRIDDALLRFERGSEPQHRNFAREILNVYRLIPKALLFAAVASAAFYVLHRALFSASRPNDPIPFILLEAVSQASLAVFTGFCFYLVTVTARAASDKKNIRRFVVNRIDGILNGIVESNLREKTKVPHSIPITETEAKQLFSQLEQKPDILPAVSDSTGKSYTWFILFLFEKKRVEREIALLLQISHLLDSELIQILGGILDSKFLFWLDECKKLGMGFSQVSVFAVDYAEYQNLKVKLTIYACRNDLMPTMSDKERMWVDKLVKEQRIDAEDVDCMLKKVCTRRSERAI